MTQTLSQAGTVPAADLPGDRAAMAAGPQPALICLDDLAGGGALLAHGRAVAAGLSTPITLGHVLENRPHDLAADAARSPLRRERAHAKLVDLGSGAQRPVLLEGRPCDQLLRWIARHRPAFVALYTRAAAHPEVPRRLGHVAATLLAESGTSVLLVPPEIPATARYRRILLPLDGSFGSERAIPMAANLAAAHDAELLLVHVVPAPELTVIGPIERAAIELRERVLARNEHVVRDYLQSIRHRLMCARQPASVHVGHGDARDSLPAIGTKLGADLIILSTLGNGGHGSQGCGHVAAHLAGAARTPVLLVKAQAGDGPVPEPAPAATVPA
ncbi:universal stress protein [Sphingomonas changnyeongensis]|uniref:Universal stress protein n=1 Tax=Sphingomonas changnyeongensis TaxID=2698679 RepID=A0A7Z2NW62_9SPHN|nr:universal stress protein [Sphingomonas changnyeongensis]QHL90475.1 universal stress protein [Sphingomonas changnyeongensis]